MMDDVTHEGLMTRVRELGFTVTLSHDPRSTPNLDTWLDALVMAERLLYLRRDRWNSERRLDALPQDALIGTLSDAHQQRAVLVVRDTIVHVWIGNDDQVHASVHSRTHSPGDFEAVISQLKGWLEPKQEVEPETVEIGFRYMGDGPAYYARTIKVPAWSEIASNYAGGVQTAVEALTADFKPGEGGRLLLLHGMPGTGKTYVIRALAREWRTWCHVEYIADPEAFLGDANYMMHVLIRGSDDIDDAPGGESDDGWRLLVLEDAGELLMRDAKARQGQGLSRLLNIGEGLIGQGMRVMTLITTNERIETLNEAVARPGRTAAEIEFTPLSVEECQTWLAANEKSEHEVTHPLTLAELYAVRNGARITAQKPVRPLGFGRN